MSKKIYNYCYVFSAILTIYIQHFKDRSYNLCSFQNSFFNIAMEVWLMAQLHSLYPRYIWLENHSSFPYWGSFWLSSDFPVTSWFFPSFPVQLKFITLSHSILFNTYSSSNPALPPGWLHGVGSPLENR